MGLVWDLLAPGYGLLPLFIFPYLHYHFLSVPSLIKGRVRLLQEIII